ncbi:hypothetical protein D4764_11G0003080 [Takifugu flavidus]|uniref:DUF5641 domain-containing protein n=1 Tax=Takifugu flavidus TaxID=433684 RepID=A0A5C6PIH0_9TELE|nr:hypothetical protein D4764_11G0003080 [Takifugu flavidus]
MNARPLVPISYDAEIPEMLSPATPLTQKASVAPAPLGDFKLGHLCKVQWRQVKSLADSFWKRWRVEYLATLQPRRKWTTEKPDLQEGDIVLIKDIQANRNDWPLGRNVKAIPSSDSKVQKVMVKTLSQGVLREYLRSIADVVLLSLRTPATGVLGHYTYHKFAFEKPPTPRRVDEEGIFADTNLVIIDVYWREQSGINWTLQHARGRFRGPVGEEL